MFEVAEVGRRVGKAVYKEQVAQLRVDLINAQYDLRAANFPVILVLAGDDRIGCNAMGHIPGVSLAACGAMAPMAMNLPTMTVLSLDMKET